MSEYEYWAILIEDVDGKRLLKGAPLIGYPLVDKSNNFESISKTL